MTEGCAWIKGLKRPPVIFVRRPSLTPPGPEIDRLESHHNWVWALAVLRDGRLVSGGLDRTIRLWDPAGCRELARLEVNGGILCLLALPDGGLVAGDQLGRLHWLETLT
jgi:WD40 repeat protein